jgi:hypothetical protein
MREKQEMPMIVNVKSIMNHRYEAFVRYGSGYKSISVSNLPRDTTLARVICINILAEKH